MTTFQLQIHDELLALHRVLGTNSTASKQTLARLIEDGEDFGGMKVCDAADMILAVSSL